MGMYLLYDHNHNYIQAFFNVTPSTPPNACSIQSINFLVITEDKSERKEEDIYDSNKEKKDTK
ncbi:hypothetical protein METP1_03173 [Methanosarcinales archaeon]|nr:hypothetical protein METP1_03173 [Methanosarcinales archaeon]